MNLPIHIMLSTDLYITPQHITPQRLANSLTFLYNTARA